MLIFWFLVWDSFILIKSFPSNWIVKCLKKCTNFNTKFCSFVESMQKKLFFTHVSVWVGFEMETRWQSLLLFGLAFAIMWVRFGRDFAVFNERFSTKFEDRFLLPSDQHYFPFEFKDVLNQEQMNIARFLRENSRVVSKLQNFQNLVIRFLRWPTTRPKTFHFSLTQHLGNFCHVFKKFL
jgi:hypothetical protein